MFQLYRLVNLCLTKNPNLIYFFWGGMGEGGRAEGGGARVNEFLLLRMQI